MQIDRGENGILLNNYNKEKGFKGLEIVKKNYFVLVASPVLIIYGLFWIEFENFDMTFKKYIGISHYLNP